MNILKSLPFVFAALVASSVCLHAAKVVYTIGDGGSLKWNGWTGDNCSCYEGGEGCKMTITTGIAIRDNGNTWEVSGQAETGLFDISEPQVYQQTFGVTNYVFPSGYLVTDPHDFPEVPAGTRINLAGAITDDKGFFIINVPK